MSHVTSRRRYLTALTTIFALFVLAVTGCSGLSQKPDHSSGDSQSFNHVVEGRSIRMQTYNSKGKITFQTTELSLRLLTDPKLSTLTPDRVPTSNVSSVEIRDDAKVFQIETSMIYADAAITDVSKQLPETSSLDDSVQSGAIRDISQSAPRTIMVFSQDATTIAVYAGDAVSVYDTDIPEATVFSIDGHYVMIYRAEYIVKNGNFLHK